jgi:branched-chain amino acid transport system ATP-binding protein
VARPAVILVDEPTEGLSPLLVDTLVESLRRISQQGTTILLVEQSADVAFALSTHLYVIDQGRICFDGPPDALRGDEALQTELLGV